MTRIHVSVRVKPDENPLKSIAYGGEKKKVELTVPGGGGGKHEFLFDNVLEPNETQKSVFEHHAHLIDETLEGFNTTIFAYGQTGAGKTHTVTGKIGFDATSTDGSSGNSSTQQGLVIRAATRLFDHARKMNADTISFSFSFSVLEIYNESLYDLLTGDRSFAATLSFGSTAPTTSATMQAKLSIVDTPGGIIIPGLIQMPLSSEEDAYQLLLSAHNNRIVAEHSMNRKSSRSHVIYTYYVTRTITKSPDSDPEVVQSKLHLVDLAGSERVEKTQSEGKLLKEANHINKSLTFLEQVVVALCQSKRDHIPYRQSKLTYCLKDSLGGNCKTFMIACIWPHEQHAWETLSTLRFAARMKNVENAPLRNKLVSKEPASVKLLQQVEALKRELAMRDVIAGTDPWLPVLTKKQRERTIRSAYTLATVAETPSPSAVKDGGSSSSLLDSSLDEVDLSVHSLSHVRLLVGALRAALWEACGHDAEKVHASFARLLSSLSMHPHPSVVQQAEGAVFDEEDDGKGASAEEMRGGEDGQEAVPAEAAQSGPAELKTDDEGQTVVGLDGTCTLAAVASPLEHSAPPIQEIGMTFEEFVATEEGAPLHADYEAAKKTLSTCKGRQNKIVALLNKLKNSIDDVQNQLLEVQGAAETGTGDDTQLSQQQADATASASVGAGAEDLKLKLTAAKRDYRLAAKELDLCKAQVKETEALKKRAMTILLEAFDSSRVAVALAPPLPPHENLAV